jgi:hypothetical protein
MPFTADDVAAALRRLPPRVHLTPDGNTNCRGHTEPPTRAAPEEFDLERINRAVQEIPLYFEPRRTMNKSSTSYGMKHVLQYGGRAFSLDSDTYMTNGDFIVAMLLCGYRCSFGRSINCHFNVKWKKGVF